MIRAKRFMVLLCCILIWLSSGLSERSCWNLIWSDYQKFRGLSFA